MWLDNLYMRMKYDSTAPNPRQYQYATLAGLAPLVGPRRWQAQHYITRSTFQGDGLGPAVGVWADESGYIESVPSPPPRVQHPVSRLNLHVYMPVLCMHPTIQSECQGFATTAVAEQLQAESTSLELFSAADCTFANLGGDAFADGCADCSAAVNAANVSVTIVNSTFLEPSPFPGTAYVRAWGDSRVVISGCTFAATPELLDAPFYIADSSAIYTDADAGDMRVRSGDDGLEVTFRPLAAVPTTPADSTKAVLQRSDPWFVNITGVRPATTPSPPLRPPCTDCTSLGKCIGTMLRVNQACVQQRCACAC